MLTAHKIKDLAPSEKRYTITDARGLALEVRPSGRMSWRYRYRLLGKPCKTNIGRYPEIGLTEARAKRDELAAAIRAGESPAEQKRRERAEALRRVTVREFGQRYYREVVENTRKNPKDILRYLMRDVYPAIGDLPIAKVDAQDMQAIIFGKRDAGHGQAAVAIRNLLKRIWDYAIVCGAAVANPAHATPAKYIAKARQRTRTLNESELQIFLRALATARIEQRFRIALLLILLNLVRKSELRRARWGHINLDKREWLIPAENSKTGRELLIYMSRQSAELFAQLKAESTSDLVMPMATSRTQPIAPSTLNGVLGQVATGLAHFTIHDLRRTGSTLLNEMDFADVVVEKALNHTKKGVAGVYNRAEYGKQRREMLQAWADLIDSLRGFQGQV